MVTKGFTEEAAALVTAIQNWPEAGADWLTPEAMMAEVLNTLYEESYRAGFIAGTEAVAEE